MKPTYTCSHCGQEHFLSTQGYERQCPEDGPYGTCHECGKAAKLVPSGAAAKDLGSVCQECFNRLADARLYKGGDDKPRSRRKPTKRQVKETTDDLRDLLKELEV